MTTPKPEYSMHLDSRYAPLETINIPALVEAHKHEKEDEFFLVLEGSLLIDLEDRTVPLACHQGFMVPRGVTHRTRAPKRTVILMVEGKTVDPVGDPTGA